jgi:hypothetical protein
MALFVTVCTSFTAEDFVSHHLLIMAKWDAHDCHLPFFYYGRKISFLREYLSEP